MITKSKLFKVIEVMEEGLKNFPTFQVDMDSDNLTYGNFNTPPCGCHASFYSACIGHEEGVHFVFGAEALASDLGFKGPCKVYELEEWALENSDTWGNIEGDLLFDNHVAFNVSQPEELEATTIVEHWKKVLSRLD